MHLKDPDEIILGSTAKMAYNDFKAKLTMKGDKTKNLA
jgi:hypothetical protein